MERSYCPGLYQAGRSGKVRKTLEDKGLKTEDAALGWFAKEELSIEEKISRRTSSFSKP
jgi:hypothetical protein